MSDTMPEAYLIKHNSRIAINPIAIAEKLKPKVTKCLTHAQS